MTPVLQGVDTLCLQINRNPFSRIDIRKLRDFILSRKTDYGFAFCRPLPPSLPETYYAIYVLKSVGEDIPDKEKLIEFLKSNLRNNLHSIFYAFNSLSLLGEKLPDMSDLLFLKLDEALNRTPRAGTEITVAYSSETPNFLKEVYMITHSLRLLDPRHTIPESVKTIIENFRKDGGFGITFPNLRETYYCVFILCDEIKRDDAVITFVEEHECHKGGFTKSPGGYPPYLEETYYALLCLKLLGHRANEKTIEYISSLQNFNGGFRRSISGGISTLENTYYAIASLRCFESEL